ncbi:MAG: nitronate monooxygenase [Gammaproteobacteria bacterium]|nr:nitronate monooxygenase [Gammaproteobacteria bacterium]
MALSSRLTQALGIEVPVLLAPMANVAGGRLAAAVTRAGGLGLIGGGYGDPEWLGAELAAAGDAPVGVGFITWRLAERPALLDLALAARPRAVLLSFGDIAPFAARIHAAGAVLIAQVQTVAAARAAAAAGAQVIVAQGGEAGGHGGQRGTLPLVPAVVDAVAPLPVVAAGGIADGRGLAAALLLGASGAMIGSRFYASQESLAFAAGRAAALAASGDDTVKGAVYDRLRGYDWPPGYALRTLSNDLTSRWPSEAAGLDASLADERAAFLRAVEAGDTRAAPVIVGEAADLITDLPPAADIVRRIAREAEDLLRAAPRLTV